MVTSNMPADNLHFDRAMIFYTMAKVGLKSEPRPQITLVQNKLKMSFIFNMCVYNLINVLIITYLRLSIHTSVVSYT